MVEKLTKSNLNYKYRIIPLGVFINSDIVTFSVSIPNTFECKLLLFQENNSKPKKEIRLTNENRIGNVFTYEMNSAEFIYDSYLYETQGKKFVDPYAKRLIGREIYGKDLYQDNSVVRGGFDFETFDWEDDKQLETPYSNMILYKLHVRGFTKDPSSGVKNRGTYLGMIEKISYLKDLGVNTVLIMPTVEFDEVIPSAQNYRIPNVREEYRYKVNSHKEYMDIDVPVKLNYWGYTNECQYFSPKSSYASKPDNANLEFKAMVKEYHKHGISVIMEMYFDSGVTPLLILDCLRFWAMEYHVDGFRLINILGIETLLATDPYLSNIKLLYHSWNTEVIYGRGTIPINRTLAEFNDNFLTDTRRFLKGDEGQVAKFIDRFRDNSIKKGIINYLTDNNGFTLMDLYSNDRKHNERNGENNHDGTDYNYSWNCGVEGASRKKKIIELRTKMRKNALALLILSQGVPMLLAGDEFGNSQGGNNNAYCQDNETSWLNWNDIKGKDSLVGYTKDLIKMKKMHKVFCNTMELKGMDYISCGYPDISFHGTKAWRPEYFNYSRTLGILLCGNYAKIDTVNVDDSFYIAFNMHWESHHFDLPDLPRGFEWCLLLATDEQLMNIGIEKEKKTKEIVNHEKIDPDKIDNEKIDQDKVDQDNVEQVELSKEELGLEIKKEVLKKNVLQIRETKKKVDNSHQVNDISGVRNMINKQGLELTARSIAIFISKKKELI